ncbi:Chromo domain/shadow [Penicillium expansum]|nr:Chromo domain/shadow [Penicillium expansum]
MFIGPGKRPLGAFRLCGMRSDVQSSLILAKNPRTGQVEVWFKHLCTVREYEKLCQSSETNSVLSTGWVEGFSDTNENLFHLAEDLRKDDLIAIHYPMGSINLAWVAWSRGSQEFRFPRPKNEVPPGIPLLIAARTMLAPIEVLSSSGPVQPSGQPHGFLPDKSLSLRVEPPSADDGLEADGPLRRSNFRHDMGIGGSLQSRETPTPVRAQIFPPASELKNNSNSANAHPQENIAVQAAQLGRAAEEIMRARKIEVEELATIEEGGKSSKAGIFYLHFPKDNDEIKQELQFLQLLLSYHEKIVFTGDSPKDRAKFVQNSRQGVAIRSGSHSPMDSERKQTQTQIVDIDVSPRILEWIERRLGDENYSQDHELLLLIYTLIIKNNVTDPRVDLFDKASLHLNSKSNVIAPSLDEYGTRTEHHALEIKDKVERDADHLIEFFAGWSLINIPRFRNFVAVTSLGPSTGPRWDEWGHMTVMRTGFGHFFKRFRIDSVGLMAYLSGVSKARPSGTSQVATPLAVATPQTPNWTSHNSNAAIQSTFTGSPNGNGTNKYPAPYK